MKRGTGCAIATAGLVLLLAGCSAAPKDVSVTTLPTDTGPAPALTQVGSSSQVADVQDAAARALTAALQIFDVDEQGKPLTSRSERENLVATTTTGPRRKTLEHAVATQLGTPPFRRGGQFVVDHWDGIQVVGDRARVFVSGHSSYVLTTASSQERDGTWQYQLLLVRRDDRWLEVRGRAASDEQG